MRRLCAGMVRRATLSLAIRHFGHAERSLLLVATAPTLSKRMWWAPSSAPAVSKQEKAAIVIQKHSRGYLARNFPLRFFSETLPAHVGNILGKAKKVIYNAAVNKVEDLVEWLIFVKFDLIARKIGKKIRRALVNMDPFAFEEIKVLIGGVFDMVWPKIAQDMHREYALRFDKEHVKKKRAIIEAEGRVEVWPPAPSLREVGPWKWLRCHLLYSWMPADSTFFGQLRDPTVWPWLLLFLYPLPQISLAIWILLLLCIDRNDIYQLTHFTVLYRGAAFISIGIVWSVQGFVKLYTCTLGEKWDCDVAGPGVGDKALQAMMFCMLRMLLGSIAWTELIDLRKRKSGEERENAATEGEKKAIKSPSRVATGASEGSKLGLRLGMLMSTLVIARGEYLYFKGRFFDSVFSPIIASVCMTWILQLFGTFVGGWISLQIHFHAVDWRPLERYCRNTLPRRLGWLKSWLIERWVLLLERYGPRGAAPSAADGYCEEEMEGTAPLKDKTAPSSTSIWTQREIDAAIRIQKTLRGMVDRALCKVIANDPIERSVDTLTRLMLWEATAMCLIIAFTLKDLYLRVGPTALWERSEQYSQLGVLSQFLAYFFFVWSDGLLFHWQAATATYCLVAVGSLLSFFPFLVVKIPLIGSKLLKMPKKTAYDRAGGLRPVMSRKEAYDKWMREQSLLEKMEREELDAIKARVCKRPSSRDLLGKAVYEKDLQA